MRVASNCGGESEPPDSSRGSGVRVPSAAWGAGATAAGGGCGFTIEYAGSPRRVPRRSGSGSTWRQPFLHQCQSAAARVRQLCSVDVHRLGEQLLPYSRSSTVTSRIAGDSEELLQNLLQKRTGNHGNRRESKAMGATPQLLPTVSSTLF